MARKYAPWCSVKFIRNKNSGILLTKQDESRSLGFFEKIMWKLMMRESGGQFKCVLCAEKRQRQSLGLLPLLHFYDDNAPRWKKGTTSILISNELESIYKENWSHGQFYYRYGNRYIFIARWRILAK